MSGSMKLHRGPDRHMEFLFWTVYECFNLSILRFSAVGTVCSIGQLGLEAAILRIAAS